MWKWLQGQDRTELADIQASRCKMFISPSFPPLVTPATPENSSCLGWLVAVYRRRDHFCSTVLFPYSGHGWTLAFGWVRYWSDVCSCREREKITPWGRALSKGPVSLELCIVPLSLCWVLSQGHGWWILTDLEKVIWTFVSSGPQRANEYCRWHNFTLLRKTVLITFKVMFAILDVNALPTLIWIDNYVRYLLIDVLGVLWCYQNIDQFVWANPA